MVSHGGVPPGLGSDSSAAANIAAANIANLAMRLGVTQVNSVPLVLDKVSKHLRSNYTLFFGLSISDSSNL